MFESNKDGALIKVIDFGTSRIFDSSEKMNQKFGTVSVCPFFFYNEFKPYYIAPEVLKKKYDEKCDIWSCGVILYILLCGYPPFNGQNDKAIMEKVAKGVYNFDGEEWQQISTDAKTLIRKMLEYDPSKRLSAEQCYQDIWLKKYAKKDLVEIPIITKALENMRTFRVNSCF